MLIRGPCHSPAPPLLDESASREKRTDTRSQGLREVTRAGTGLSDPRERRGRLAREPLALTVEVRLVGVPRGRRSVAQRHSRAREMERVLETVDLHERLGAVAEEPVAEPAQRSLRQAV